MPFKVVDGPARVFEFAPAGQTLGEVRLIDKRVMPLRDLVKVRKEFNKLIVSRPHDKAFVFRSQGARFEYRPIRLIDPKVWQAVRRSAAHAPFKAAMKRYSREAYRGK